MYLATKDGSLCRIPDKKAPYYESMGYSLEKLGTKDGEVKTPAKEKKTSKKESDTQEGLNPANN